MRLPSIQCFNLYSNAFCFDNGSNLKTPKLRIEPGIWMCLAGQPHSAPEKRFVVHSDEELTVYVELQTSIRRTSRYHIRAIHTIPGSGSRPPSERSLPNGCYDRHSYPAVVQWVVHKIVLRSQWSSQRFAEHFYSADPPSGERQFGKLQPDGGKALDLAERSRAKINRAFTYSIS
jgi:hypothetical protein